MLARTDAAYAFAKQALGAASDPMLKQMVVSHLVVLAVAEAEDSLESLIVSHFSGVSPSAESLARSCLSSLLRSIKTSEISGFLNRLGGTHKERFQASLKKDEPAESAYNNLIQARHAIVHEATCNLTFEEFGKSLAAIHFVCAAVRDAL